MPILLAVVAVAFKLLGALTLALGRAIVPVVLAALVLSLLGLDLPAVSLLAISLLAACALADCAHVHRLRSSMSF